MKREYKPIDTEEQIRKENAFNENMSCAICALGFVSATAMLAGLTTGGLNNPHAMHFFIIGGAISTSALFILFKRLRKKMEAKARKDILATDNLFEMLKEISKQDRIIDSETSLFLNEISLAFESHDIKLSGDDMLSLNKLLFLINANYYDKIAGKISSMTREKMINHIINQAAVYYKKTGKKTFDENEAKNILDYCLLIRPELKDQIYKEFKESKVNLAGSTDYAINRKKEKSSSRLFTDGTLTEEGLKEKNGYDFDITSMSDINSIIIAANGSKYYQQFGNPNSLDWDMDFLSRVLTTVALNYRQKLIEYHPDYSNLALATSLITNTITYALVNNRQQVGQREILSSFKNWYYVPFSIQDRTLTKLFEEDEIDYSLHPYRERRDPALATKQKVIKLSDYNEINNKTTE